MKIKPALHLVTVFAICLFSPAVYAASIALEPEKSSLNSPADEFPVNVNFQIDAPDNKVYYLRGIFYQPDTSNYCGYTWNGNSWFKGPYSSGEGWKNFFPVTIKTGSWSGEIKTKIDPEDSGCRDTGTYRFKIERFTESGSGSFDSQNELTLTVVVPTLIPSPTDTPDPTKTPAPSHTLTPAKTPTPPKIPTLTFIPTYKPASENTKKTAVQIPFPDNPEKSESMVPGTKITVLSASPTAVLGIQSNLTDQVKTPTRSGQLIFRSFIVSLSLIGAGLGILSVIYIFKHKNQNV
jgi:hypothetical protein